MNLVDAFRFVDMAMEDELRFQSEREFSEDAAPCMCPVMTEVGLGVERRVVQEEDEVAMRISLGFPGKFFHYA